jgi:enoyl-CoA hydratase/carnithine racemase
MTEDLDELGNDDLRVDVSDDGLVARATIDRPDRRNALGETVMRGLLALIEAADESEVRVVVVRGGEDVFSAGGDFTEMPIGGTAQEYRESFAGLSRVMLALRDCSALTVAAVDGDCLAGGLGLAASCEFLVASESASFATPEVDVGLFPVQAMVPIMRTVPEKRGLKLLFTGESIDAHEAHDMGLVTDVYPDHEFDEGLDSFVDALAASSPVMISMGKEAYREQRGRDFESALAYCREVIALMAMSEDTEEGIEAFMMDRQPEWSGR